MTIISWELFNITLYLIVTNNNSTNLSAGLKYILLSALSTGFLLLGISIKYFVIGNTNYEKIQISLIQIINNSENISHPALMAQGDHHLSINTISDKASNGINLIGLSQLLIFITILFKISAVPFYNWAPDLYDNLKSNITKFMKIIPKITICIFMLIINNDIFAEFNLGGTNHLILSSAVGSLI